MRASSIFSFEDGMSTRECLAREALRTRVSKSAIGSVFILPRLYLSLRYLVSLVSLESKKLPARFGHSGNLALQRESAETDTAHLELAQERARASANPAAVAPADLELRRLLLLGELCGSSHISPVCPAPKRGTALPVASAARGLLRRSWPRL